MISIFHVVHVFSLFMLVGVTLVALAAPLQENRRKYLMWSGIASLCVFISGFGLLGMLHYGWPLWVIVKLGCWFLLSGIVGIALRQREKVRELFFVTSGLALLALIMVYFQPQ